MPATRPQDRISTAGELVHGGSSTGGGAASAPPYVIGTPTDRPAAPSAPPLSQPDLDRLVEVVAGARGRLLVLTGAGCSTESNIPDYRSPTGAYSTGFKPMTHQQARQDPSSAGGRGV